MIFHTVIGITRLKHGIMDEREFALRNIAVFTLVIILSYPHRERRAAGCVERRCAGHDSIEVLRKFLRGFESLPSAGRATVEVRESRVIAIEGRDKAFAFFAHLVHRSITEIDQFVLVLHPWP